MTKQSLEHALETTKAAVVKAGEELMKHFGNIESEMKSNTGYHFRDVVTRLDREIENIIAEELGLFDLTIGFRGEEFGIRSDAKKTWLVDPIDGTAHFMRGLPFCTTMVALIEDNQVVMSVIYDFVRKDIYTAIKGKGAYRNNERIYISTRPLSQAFISIETRLEDQDNLSTFLNLGKLANTVKFMASGFEFAMIASGKLEGKIAENPYGYDWDFAAGSLLIEEAGGKVTNIGKSTYTYTNHDFIMTNPIIHQELTEGSNAIFPLRNS